MYSSVPLPIIPQAMIGQDNTLLHQICQFPPSNELLPTPEAWELIANQYILPEPLDPNAIVNPRTSWLSLTADIKPVKERRKVKTEPGLEKLPPGTLPSITSKSVIRAAMNERVKKLDRLQQADESTMDPGTAAQHRKEKIRLLTLERSRRAAQLRRIKKKQYVKNLEGRIGMMAKHLERLEIENDRLRMLVNKWTEAAAAGEILPDITSDSLTGILPLVSEVQPAVCKHATGDTTVKADPAVVESGSWPDPMGALSGIPQLDITMGIPLRKKSGCGLLPLDYISPNGSAS